MVRNEPTRLGYTDTSETLEVRERLLAMVARQKAHFSPETEKLKTIYLFLTRKCNLGCQHCYIEGVGPNARDNDFNFTTVRHIVEQALPHGLRRVKVSGGEPTIHKEFFDILEYLGGLGLEEIILETNGTLLDDLGIQRLSRIPRMTVFVSIDHDDADLHDQFRQRQGSHAKAVNAVKSLCDAGVRVIVTTTANRSNYQQILDIVERTLGWGVAKHRTLLNIHPLGNAKEHLENALSIAECCTLIEGVIGSDHFKTGRAYVTLPPALLPLEHLNEVHSCGWGKDVIGVLSNGDISMCSASYDDPNMVAGNVFQQDLIDVWQHSNLFQELREVGAGNVKGVCSNCIFYSVCRGVCRMSSYGHYGEKDAPYPFCQEMYNIGKFPAYALVDPTVDCTYRPNTILQSRPQEARPLVQLRRGATDHSRLPSASD